MEHENTKPFSNKMKQQNVSLAMNKEETNTKWLGTWATSQQGIDMYRGEYPPKPGLANNTLRQIVRISVGGSKLRLKISNEYGQTPLELKSVHIARPVKTGLSTIEAETDTKVTFLGGHASVTVPVGEVITSDMIEYTVSPLETIAISICFGDVPAIVTGHPGSRTTSFIGIGNQVSNETLTDETNMNFWYYITSIDVIASPNSKAIVCFGDSITDGRGVRDNYNERWTDILAERLATNPATSHISVLNHGIGGNAIFGGLGPAGYLRYPRDVIEQEGVAYVIVFEGINDIGNTSSPDLEEQLIEKYISFAEQAHAKGLKIYGATITPFGHNDMYYTKEHGALREQIRQGVNAWIRNNDYYDGVIDFDKMIQDEVEPLYMKAEFDTDGLHPSYIGYKEMGSRIDLGMFRDEE